MENILKPIANISEFLHRSGSPVDLDGAKPSPSFLKQKIDDVHTELVRGKPFKLSDLVCLSLSFLCLLFEMNGFFY